MHEHWTHHLTPGPANPEAREPRAFARVLFVLCPVGGPELAGRGSSLNGDPDAHYYMADMQQFVGEAPVRGFGDVDILAINRAIPAVCWSSRMRHAASLHGELLEGWLLKYMGADRRKVAAHSSLAAPGVDHVWNFLRSVPSSAMFGVLVGMALGYELVVTNAQLTGQPYETYRPEWQALKNLGHLENVRWYQAKDRSDGWVKKLLRPIWQ